MDCLAKGEFGNGRQNKALRVGGALRILGRSYSSTHCRLLDPSTYDDIAGTRANQICGFRVRRCLSNTGPRERLGVHHRISRTLTTSPFSFLSKQTAKMLLSFLDVQLVQTGLGLRSGKRGHPHPAEQLHFSQSTVLLAFTKRSRTSISSSSKVLGNLPTYLCFRKILNPSISVTYSKHTIISSEASSTVLTTLTSHSSLSLSC